MEVRVIRRLGHEHIACFHDYDARLAAYVAIHSTRLGPALGGVRMRPYPTEEDALEDVLHLSRAMTYKAALAGLPLGGGKAVIVGDPAKDKTPELWKAFGKCLEKLGGRYIAAEDMGTTAEDMDSIARVTPHVTGTSAARGGSGDPSAHTARGVLAGIRAALKWKLGGEGLVGCRVATQGLGAVGMELAASLFRAGASLIVSDIRPERAEEAARRFRAWRARPEEVHRVECEVFSPCALGGVLNERTVEELRCSVVAGSANNQLASPEAGEALAARGILYAPDYVVNAGGLIAAAAPLVGLTSAQRDARVVGVAERLLDIFRRAEREGLRPEEAADRAAEEVLRAAPAPREGAASHLGWEAGRRLPSGRGARRASGVGA